MHLRLYECLEVHNLSTWTMIEDMDMSSVPSPVLASQGTPTLTAASLEPGSSPSHTAQLAVPGTAGGSQGAGVGQNAVPTRPGIGAREADGGWCLSWCKEKWWGEIMAVGCGTTGILKVTLSFA